MLKIKKADFDQKYLTKVVDKVKKSKYEWGCSAMYVKINNDMGVKFFFHKSDRDYTYRKHFLAHKVGVGPEVGSKLSFQLTHDRYGRKENSKVYGYLIEHVKVACENSKKGTEDWEDEGLLELEDRCIANDLPWPDLHSGNFGVSKTGQLVRIDFGDCAWGSNS